jgi:hypothetical protein
VCGNNIVEGDENCDNSSLNGKSCKGLGYKKGKLACQPDCSFDESDCKESDDTANEKKSASNTNTVSMTSSSVQNVQNTGSRQAPSVAIKIENGNETRTLEIEQGSTETNGVIYNSGNGEIRVIPEGSNREGEVIIRVSRDTFVIERKGKRVISPFSLVVDNNTGKIFVESPAAGRVLVSVFPDAIYRKIRAQKNLEIVGDVKLDVVDCVPVYAVKIEKRQKLLKLIPIKIPYSVFYNLQDGKHVKIDMAILYKILDFLSYEY